MVWLAAGFDIIFFLRLARMEIMLNQCT